MIELNTNYTFFKTEEYLSINLNSDTTLTLEENKDLTIYLRVNTLKESNLNINILPNSSLKLVIHLEGSSPLNVSFNVGEHSTLNLYSSVLCPLDNIVNMTINLNGRNAIFNGYEYLVSSNNKISGIYKVNHLNKDTTSKTKLMYLSKNNGLITRKAISNIEKGMDNSSASESIKGLILDKYSRIDAEPILVVSNDDVIASHGCAIGTIDDNEIYYLMSRGLSREDALKIICKSLINPILKEIKNDEFYSYLDKELSLSIMEG